MKCPGAPIGTKDRQCQSDGACRAVNLRKFEKSGANLGSKLAPNFWGGTEKLLNTAMELVALATARWVPLEMDWKKKEW